MIGWGVRLTHDAGPAMTPEQEARIARAIEAGRAALEVDRFASTVAEKCRWR